LKYYFIHDTSLESISKIRRLFLDFIVLQMYAMTVRRTDKILMFVASKEHTKDWCVTVTVTDRSILRF